MAHQHGGPGAGTELRVISDLVTFLATSEQTGGAFTLYRSVTPPGAGVPPHCHPGVSEVCLVIAGEYTFLRAETILRVVAGEVVCVPGGEVHAFTNTGRTPGQLLVVAAPGQGIEGFFRAAGALSAATPPEEPPAPPDTAHLIALAALHGIELLPQPRAGPPAALTHLATQTEKLSRG